MFPFDSMFSIASSQCLETWSDLPPGVRLGNPRLSFDSWRQFTIILMNLQNKEKYSKLKLWEIVMLQVSRYDEIIVIVFTPGYSSSILT